MNIAFDLTRSGASPRPRRSSRAPCGRARKMRVPRGILSLSRAGRPRPRRRPPRGACGSVRVHPRGEIGDLAGRRRDDPTAISQMSKMERRPPAAFPKRVAAPARRAGRRSFLPGHPPRRHVGPPRDPPGRPPSWAPPRSSPPRARSSALDPERVRAGRRRRSRTAASPASRAASTSASARRSAPRCASGMRSRYSPTDADRTALPGHSFHGNPSPAPGSFNVQDRPPSRRRPLGIEFTLRASGRSSPR